jgi:transmembrane sensor
MEKYLAGTITGPEWEQLVRMSESAPNQVILQKMVDDILAAGPPGEDEERKLRDLIYRQMERRMQVREPAPVIRVRRLATAAAAIVLLIAGVAAYRFSHDNGPRSNGTHPAMAATQGNDDVLPGSNKATLTLSNGTVVLLDSVHNDAIPLQGGSHVLKAGDQLIYAAAAVSSREKTDMVYNILSTPRGGQYRLNLPDGSRVWLNAASSIKYPTTFTGKDRVVSITGEAYFEVTDNQAMPFKVRVNDAEITVLGTHFNVMAYEDEGPANTTLLEGSVKISQSNSSTLLQPGERAEWDAKGDIKLRKDVDVNEAVAWKNGYFYFNHAGLPSVLRQLTRWYDIEVVYKGMPPVRQFEGEIERDLTLSQVLKLLERNGVQFTIQGKKLIVMP